MGRQEVLLLIFVIWGCFKSWWDGVSLVRTFIPGVTQRKEGAVSVQDFIVSFLCESR